MVKKKICFEFDTEADNLAEALGLTESETKELDAGLANILATSNTFGEVLGNIVEKWDGKMAAAALMNAFRFLGKMEGVKASE